VLDLLHELKGAAAMTDPTDTDTAQRISADELPDELLDEVAGGTDSSVVRPQPAMGLDASLVKQVGETLLVGPYMPNY
jgi:hypothetical protein